MSSSSSGGGEIFDLRKIRRLAELMNEQDLSEIDLRHGEVRVCVRRGGVAPLAPVAAPVAAAPVADTSTPKSAAPAAVDDAHVEVVKSPMVGTLYLASAPDQPPFIKVGDHVGADTTVCIVEAMKVFNEIPAGVSGRIIAVLAENGEPVEFGQALFKVDTRK